MMLAQGYGYSAAAASQAGSSGHPSVAAGTRHGHGLMTTGARGADSGMALGAMQPHILPVHPPVPASVPASLHGWRLHMEARPMPKACGWAGASRACGSAAPAPRSAAPAPRSGASEPLNPKTLKPLLWLGLACSWLAYGKFGIFKHAGKLNIACSHLPS